MEAHGNTRDERGGNDKGMLGMPLTRRERDIVVYLRSGATNPEIAHAFDSSLNTVKTHLRHAYAKLGVRNRTQAALRARDLGEG